MISIEIHLDVVNDLNQKLKKAYLKEDEVPDNVRNCIRNLISECISD